MKRYLLILFATLLFLPVRADEGMWLPSLISSRIDDMRAKGFQLTAEDIYSINQASLKDAVVLFDGGCTAELVSNRGLILTNHHCGYDAIQAHSTIDHDYLTYGFWARSLEEELPNKGLNVRFLVRMEDVTERLAKGEEAAKIIEEASKEGVGYKASIEQMYYGNQQFLFVYEQFDDVRLVGAPQSSIGKFGGDTDNWIWPRHTGDFSIFRIYADKNNKPAAYSPDNVPYTPKRFFPISTKGVKEGDFTMIYGFPGNTQEYILSDDVAYLAERSDPAKIAIRTERLNIIGKAQEADPALRIHYASKYVWIANAWKKWQGRVLGINNNKTVDKKRVYERQFEAWAQNRPEYKTIVADLKKEYARIMDAYFAREMTIETLLTLPEKYTGEERQEVCFAQREATERDLFRLLFKEYATRCPEAYRSALFMEGVKKAGSPEAYGEKIFEEIWNGKNEKSAPLRESIMAEMKKISGELELDGRDLRNLNSKHLSELYTVYVRGLQEWDTTRAFYPDANLTLRVAYGSVKGYEYRDGEYHYPQTTLDGIIAKDNPEIYDYDIPQSLRDLYKAKDYGRWGIEMNGRKTVPVCFLATPHTTGGNSGSPMINGKGELIGINFDRTWLSTMSDVAYDPVKCRNIAVDIRYVLFLIERVGNAGYLIDEMELR